jgi:glycosyltransferase involved in cell wall biosynthesis
MYEASDVYLCMSEHEGFCLPIIEAMHFGLPVLAYAAGAVPDTMGDGGILVSEKKHAEIAALIAKLAAPSELREQVIRRGRERVKIFSYENFSNRAKELIGADKTQQSLVEGL